MIGSVTTGLLTVAIRLLEAVAFFVFLLFLLYSQFFTAISTTGRLSRTGGPLTATCISALRRSDLSLLLMCFMELAPLSGHALVTGMTAAISANLRTSE